MKHNQRIGNWGEDVAAEQLAQKGYEIIGRNIRTPYGEIDIITKHNDTTIFIEVKTRTSNKMAEANPGNQPPPPAHCRSC